MPLSLGLKVDIDTLIGTRRGLPAMLDLFTRLNIRGTFYVSLGPDRTGRKVLDAWRSGMVAKAGRTNVLGALGIRTLLYGTLLPAPIIHRAAQAQLRQLRDSGFETGVHAWDHVQWHRQLAQLPRDIIARLLQQSHEIFTSVFGRPPETYAAPGWTVSRDYFALIDAMRMTYLSDTRGVSPFYPIFAGYQSSTLQLPTTLATLDELLGRQTEQEIIDYYVAEIARGQFNVMTIHTEYEGGVHLDLFTRLVRALKAREVNITGLGEMAQVRSAGSSWPHAACAMETVDGRAIPIARQSGMESSAFTT